MTDRIETVVVVTDKGSQTFQKVGSSAEKMGTQIDKAGTTGATGLTKISKAGVVAGAAFATLSGTLTLAARANAEAEASQARLETAIENTGRSAFEYEESLKAASEAALQLGFDDEDVADSIAKLTTAMGDTERAIEAVSIVEDIARARKVSLATATQLVIAAEQGRNGALARVGIVIDETATKEEALDALRSQFAGNAEAYAETSAAGYDRISNRAENALESVGAFLGPSQQLLMILPGLSSGFTGASAAVGALAPNLTKASAAASLLTVGIGAAAFAGFFIAGTQAMKLFGDEAYQRFIPASEQAADSITALNVAVDQLVQSQMAQAPLAVRVGDSLNYIADAASNYDTTLHELTEAQQAAVTGLTTLEAQGGKNSELWIEQKELVDSTTRALNDYFKQQKQNEVSGTELAKANQAVIEVLTDTGPAGDIARDTLEAIYNAQQAGTYSWNEYIARLIDLGVQLPIMNDNMTTATTVLDETTTATETGTAATDAYTAAQERLAQGLGVVGIGFRDLGEAGNASNTALADGVRAQNDAAAAARNHEAALKEQEGAYYRVRDGVISASDAHAIFAQTQQGIITAQGPYNQQLSEYNTQLDNITAAEDLLNERKAAGIAITAEQQKFLDGADAAQERLQGGTEDATIALGIQAEQYAENMKIGDEMNQGLGELDTSIQDLILALQGIPGYVKTNIEVDAEDAKLQADTIKKQLDALNGRTSYASVVVTGYYTGPNVGLTPGGEHGAVIPHAQHGIYNRDGQTILVGESGPELVDLPGGSRITPSPASRLRMGQAERGMTFTGNTIYVTANNPREFTESMRSWALSEARS